MAGWSAPAYQSLHNLRGTSVRSKENAAYKDHLCSVFDQMLASSFNEQRPLAVLLGDGKSVDLFKMYVTVQNHGGYDSVEGDGMWASVAQELGFEPRCGQPLKSVYSQYLSGIDRYPEQRTCEIHDGDGQKAGLSSIDSCLGEGVIVIDLTDGESVLKECHMKKDRDSVIYVAVDDGEGHADRRTRVSSKGGSFRKRKQESLVGLLNWLKVIAVNPCDPGRGRDVDGSAMEDYLLEKYWARTLAAREAIFRGRKDSCTRSDRYIQKKQRVHPSLYEDTDGSSQQAGEKVRSSQRLASLNSCPPTFSISTKKAKPRSAKPSLSRTPESIDGSYFKDQFPRLQIPIGLEFQACVPEWFGVTRKSSVSDTVDDSKWLGTQSWPSSGSSNSPTTDDQIGKGRSSSCTCPLPGSVGCIKRHICEARLRLRYELGSAFYGWRFDEMGEEVSVSWSLHDEQIFKTIVRLNHSSEGKDFWNEAYICFPTKSKSSLVSYYFNVFVLRRRSFQNRVTPGDTDSDDDEYDFGLVHDDLAAQPSISCVLDMQCDL